MKSRLAAGVVLVLACRAVGAETFRPALPGYKFQFPRDHFGHPEFRTEWWYYTGNLRTAEGRRFGFELTFFRHALQRSGEAGVWEVRDAWFAHFAVSDLAGRRFYHQERMNRSGPGLAGADLDSARVWNGNWSVAWKLDPKTRAGFVEKRLEAVAKAFGVSLVLRSEKAPVVHGVDGASQKSEGLGQASHYVSLTRLFATGTVTIEGQEHVVEGLAWMDHEFFSHSLAPGQQGWDWFSLHFEDGSDLMLYRLRRKDGSADRFSSGTLVDASGRARYLHSTDFSLVPGRTWKSPVSGAAYPIEWRVQIPALALEVEVSTQLAGQELRSRSAAVATYWEGAVSAAGTRRGKPASATGYLEMTGYAAPVNLGSAAFSGLP